MFARPRVPSLLVGAVMMAAFAVCGAAEVSDAPVAPPTVLTNAEQIAALGINFEGARYRAEIQGTVIFVSPPTRRLYVQDGERGVQVNLDGPVDEFRVGHRVAATGRPIPGLAVLRLADSAARILGNGPMPEVKEVSPHRLAAGADPFRWVSVRGFVRDMVVDRNYFTLLVAYEGLVFNVMIPAGDVELPDGWVDAELEFRGLSWPVFNSEGRASGFRFHPPSTNFVHVLRSGRTTVFDGPVLTCGETGRRPEQWGPRVRVTGTVTVHRPGTSFFIDDGTGVIHVEPLPLLNVPSGAQHLDHPPQKLLQPGDRVEVIGVRQHWFSLTPTLLQAEYRRIGPGEPVKPVHVGIRDLFDGKHSGRLVSVEARLLDQRQWNNLRLNNVSLVLRVGDEILQARWESHTPAAWNLKVGTYVRVTGVNDAEGSSKRKRSTFQLLLRSPADVVPAPEPPFWKTPEFQRVALGAGVVGCFAVGWILFQRFQVRRLEKRVAQRTADLSGANERLQLEVSARERAEAGLRIALEAEKELNQLKSGFVSMVSHEFRTPLEVILSSSTILDRYLDRLSPEVRKAQLKAIRKSVHRMSDLMEEVLLLGKFDASRMECNPAPLDLPAFCRRCVDEIDSASVGGNPITLNVDPLSAEACADESLLAHVLTNLLSNAVKYSPQGAPVELKVSQSGTDAVFVVKDNGCGIPKADQSRLFSAFHRGSNVGQVPGSGLGLVIVQRCVMLHQGTITCESEENKGTTFTVSLPVFDGTRRFHRRTISSEIS
jgi:signal transduction histidine kinase